MNRVKFILFSIFATSLMVLSSCTFSSSQNSEDPPDDPPIDYGTLSIENMVAMREGYRDIRLKFTNPNAKESLTYSYDPTYITIDQANNRIIALQEGHVVNVTASSEHFSASFSVNTDYIYYTPVLNAIETRLQDQTTFNVSSGATVFIGDSFFDYHAYWQNFYQDVLPNGSNNQVFLSGISSSTLKDWFYISDYLLYSSTRIGTPKNIVIHLGSNDLWFNAGAQGTFARLKELVSDLHYHYPDTRLYFISTENRTSVQVREHWDYRTHNSSLDTRLTLEESKQELLTFYNLAKQYADNDDKLTFINSLNHFTDDGFNCDASKFRSDGVHPNPSEYKFYANALVANGLSDIKNSYSFTASLNQDISENVSTFAPNNEELINADYVTFNLSLSNIQASKGNMFIECGFDDGNRFLFWRFNNNDYFYICGALGGTYYKNTEKYIQYHSGSVTTSKIGILLSNRHVYLFVNDCLTIILLNISNKKALRIQSCWVDVVIDNVVVYNAENGSLQHQQILNQVYEYEYSKSSLLKYQYIV